MPRFKPTPEKPLPGKAGRPSIYSQEIVDRICELMVEGNDMQTICQMPGMPSRATVWRWQNQYPEFEAQCARAREALATTTVRQPIWHRLLRWRRKRNQEENR